MEPQPTAVTTWLHPPNYLAIYSTIHYNVIYIYFIFNLFMLETYYFFFNGHEYYVESTLSILNLIFYFNYNTSLFILEYNNSIYTKENWVNTFIKNNDKIEIITIVGGG